jgi:hypothetical protein
VELTLDFSDNTPKPLLGLLVPNLPSVGSFWFCSRVALEAALDEVGSVTRVRLRSWEGIREGLCGLNYGRGGWQYRGGGLIFIIVGKAHSPPFR